MLIKFLDVDQYIVSEKVGPKMLKAANSFDKWNEFQQW